MKTFAKLYQVHSGKERCLNCGGPEAGTLTARFSSPISGLLIVICRSCGPRMAKNLEVRL